MFAPSTALGKRTYFKPWAESGPGRAFSCNVFEPRLDHSSSAASLLHSSSVTLQCTEPLCTLRVARCSQWTPIWLPVLRLDSTYKAKWGYLAERWIALLFSATRQHGPTCRCALLLLCMRSPGGCESACARLSENGAVLLNDLCLLCLLDPVHSTLPVLHAQVLTLQEGENVKGYSWD